MESAFTHGGLSLPTEGEIYLEHSIPRQVRMDSKQVVDSERLVDEIADVTGLHATLGKWEVDEDSAEMAAAVQVNVQDIDEVLNRLAHASAETFYDRYRKPIDASDTDFDAEACAQDFNVALQVCNLRWDQLDKPMFRENYLHALHRSVDEMAKRPS